jgi:hypothetical protein
MPLFVIVTTSIEAVYELGRGVKGQCLRIEVEESETCSYSLISLR